MSSITQTPYQGAFVDQAHYFALRVYMEDTDFGGVVYHANYLRYLERARSDMLRVLGIDQRGAFESGRGVYAVAEANLRYLRPARLDDALVIVSRLRQVRGASCVIGQEILRGEERILDASVTVAFLRADGRPQRQPPEWVALFERLAAGSSPSSSVAANRSQ
jgi:acyl-CoA thioester hydrolase